jgi:uncharacterized protein YijF (DUF1287 family)
MLRRSFLEQLALLSAAAFVTTPPQTNGQRLVQAARAQLGVTLSYDPNYTRVTYPNGDVPRRTGVCADVIVRAARDAFALDLQKLVHEDMLRDFDAYPARKTWGERSPDASIDHRRVLNLETYWQRAGVQLWTARNPTPGDAFPAPIAIGDILTWRLDARLPHVGIFAGNSVHGPAVIHNVGRGVEEIALEDFHPHRAAGHYRWPSST